MSLILRPSQVSSTASLRLVGFGETALSRGVDEKRVEKVREGLVLYWWGFPFWKSTTILSYQLFLEAHPASDRCHAGRPDIMTHRFHQLETLSLFK